MRLAWGTAVIFLLGQTLCSQGAEPEVIVDLRSHRSEIRAVLLKHTPLKSGTREVIEFISRHLQHNQNASVTVADGSPPVTAELKQRGTKFIRVYLGQYYDHPEVVFLAAPVLMQKEVRAIWIFDQQNRLIDIFVDKTIGTY